MRRVVPPQYVAFLHKGMSGRSVGEERRPGLSWRGFWTGAFLSFFLAIGAPYASMVMHASFMAFDFNSPGAIFLFLVLIGGLNVESGDSIAVFDDLKKGLKAPMAGMGTAFSTSLFGLGGSLVLGFLDLQANQAQNRFYNELEEWLSTVTRLATSSLLGESDQPIPAYVQALLEQTAESLENLQQTITRGEENRISVNSNIIALGNKLETLTDHMRTEQTLMKSLTETQMEMKPILAKIAEGSTAAGMDESTRSHIRNLDVYLTRLTEELSSGRKELVQQLRSEIKLLARTIAASGDD